MGKRKDSVEGVSLRDILNEAGKFLGVQCVDSILKDCSQIPSDGVLQNSTIAFLIPLQNHLKGPERNYKGLSEQRYLQFGVIWREFGARDKTASCRKMDQFIFFEDIHEFVMQICRIWGVPIPDYGKLVENPLLSHVIFFSIIKIIIINLNLR